MDFDLRLSGDGNRYFARVSNSPAGESDDVQIRIQFGAETLEALHSRLAEAVMSNPGAAAFPPSREERILREFGDQVFCEIFQRTLDIAMKFRSSLEYVLKKPDEYEGLCVKLHVKPPELAMLPWEFMFDKAITNDGAYVCLNNRSPIVRFLDVDVAPNRLPINGPVRILGMVSNPHIDGLHPIDVEAERNCIDEALKGVSKGAVEMKWVHGGTVDHLFNMIRDETWHIFHFIGHGGVDDFLDERSGKRETFGYVWMLEDRVPTKIYGAQLGLRLQDDGNLRLAVLNCCEGARGAISSVGASLVTSGVPTVVAMQYPISDRASLHFAEQFYRSLFRGDSIAHAVTEARMYMRGKSGIEWGIPVLLSRSGTDFVFHVTPNAAEAPLVAASQEFMPTSPKVNLQARDQLRKLFSGPSGPG